MREALPPMPHKAQTAPSTRIGRLQRGPRRALTLVEMLIATAVTLLMMSAVLNLFANLGTSVRDRRALLDVDARLRQVRAQLARDLAGATCPAIPWRNPGANEGYIEIVEGPYSDWNPSAYVDGNTSNGELDYTVSRVPSSQMLAPSTGLATDGRGLGDYDDVLALTVRNEDEPFTAVVPAAVFGANNNSPPQTPQVVQSSLAEVIWFAEENDNPVGQPQEGEFGLRRVFRRPLLIAPWLGSMNNIYSLPNQPPPWISAHWDGQRWVANTLGDLTKRENRFQHALSYDNSVTPPLPVGYPHMMRIGRLDYQGGPNTGVGASESEWLVLSDAVAFDVRIFDPNAPVFARLNTTTTPTSASSSAIAPSDLGWGNFNAIPANAPAVSFGAYVDLGWNWNPIAGSVRRDLSNTSIYPPSAFSLPLLPGSSHWLPRQGFPAVYDTWSLHYEADGVNQDFRRQATMVNSPPQWWMATDQGTNGLDDDGVNGVDDKRERETAPPYDVPLRGVKVILRVYERDARQVRATSVIHSFVE